MLQSSMPRTPVFMVSFLALLALPCLGQTLQQSRPQGRTLDIPVVHRKTVRVPTSGAHGQPAPAR